MRRVAVFALACLLTDAFALAATYYWAFGDSITRGSGDPITPSVVFDRESSPTGYCPRDGCGYGWRLEGALSTQGVLNEVINRGWGAEETTVGRSRIDDFGEPLYASRCSDPDAGDVLLLMEGTNDVSGILAGNGVTTTTVRNNLAYMLDLATTKCVHSAIASTVSRLLAGTSLGSKQGDWNEPVTLDLATKISNLSAQRNRAYVNVLDSLCRDADPSAAQQCYDHHFWGRLSLNDPGHVDASGYDVMAALFEGVILASPLAGSTTLTAPLGDVTNSTPTFMWDEHPDSDWYFLEVDDGSSYGRWHPEEEICGSGTCSFDLAVSLADGSYTWRVRTRNLRGLGAWSTTGSFAVWTSPPGPVTLVYPLIETFDIRPRYRWTAASGAKTYDVRVDGVVPPGLNDLDASSICAGSICEVDQPTDLSFGSHSWRVRARNPFADGPESDEVSYEVLECSLYPDLEVTNATAPPFAACVRLSTGAGGFSVGSADTVEFRAGSVIELGDGFEVLTGGTFTSRVDY